MLKSNYSIKTIHIINRGKKLYICRVLYFSRWRNRQYGLSSLLYRSSIFGIGNLQSTFNRRNNTNSVMQGSPHLVKTGRLKFSLNWLKGKVTEILVYFRKTSKMFEFLSTPPHVLPFTKQTCCIDNLKKGYNEQVWNKTLNIKPCMLKFQEHFTWILKKKDDYWWKIRTYKD